MRNPEESSKHKKYVDVIGNRSARKWSQREQIGRFLWLAALPFFRFSPRIFWGWRRIILRMFGAQIGQQVRIYPTVRITMPWNLRIQNYAAIGDRAILYALGIITIGERATISQNAHLCAGTHDWRHPMMPLEKLPIEIGQDAWICADAFVGPNLSIGRGAIVGARAVVMKDIRPNHIVVGNPARVIKVRGY